MLQQIQLLRNVGSFDSVTPGTGVPFSGFTLIYAENGRGKTTVAALLRSLGNGDANLVNERHRLGATHPPHIIFGATGATHTFQDGAWSTALPTIAVFDDAFVAANVCSGIEIESSHRQKLHELILGAQGVSLNNAVQTHVAKIEDHNRALRMKEDAIPAAAKGALTTDQFCSLKADPKLDEKIQQAERALAAAREASQIESQTEFQSFELPKFDLLALETLLARDLPSLDSGAAIQVQAHLETLGSGGERWVSEGMTLLGRSAHDDCPFCGQELSASALIDHYRAYFAAEYTALKSAISDASRSVSSVHGGEAPAAFERSVRITGEKREFWSRFADVPAFTIDTAVIALAWKEARDAVSNLIARKQATPLDAITIDESTKRTVQTFHAMHDGVTAATKPLLDTNSAIALVKEKAQSADIATLTADLSKLQTLKRRFSPEIASQCDAYQTEKTAKAVTEGLRATARSALDAYRTSIFPKYQTTINDYLTRFGAAFRLGDVGSINTRVGSSATYNVVINNQPVSLSNDNGASFRNTLSSGDRNTLALAFFFASLEHDANLANTIVVIDDPMTSLDDHRSLVTVEEIVKMGRRVRQTIVLSHSKPFLLSVWKSGPKNDRTAMRIARAAIGSTIELWQVTQDSINEHDRRYERVRAYLQAANSATERQVAADLRPMLEAWGRVAFPMEFPAEELLGGFINRCEQAVGSANQILKQADIDELRGLTNYANLFHHDTNATYQTEHINDQQLMQFSRRVINFIGKV